MERTKFPKMRRTIKFIWVEENVGQGAVLKFNNNADDVGWHKIETKLTQNWKSKIPAAWIPGIQTGCETWDSAKSLQTDKPNTILTSHRSKNATYRKKLNGSKVDFSCGWKLEISVSQRRPEFQSCLQILILFTNSIYNIEAALGKLKASTGVSYSVWEWMIYQFPLPLTAAPRIRWCSKNYRLQCLWNPDPSSGCTRFISGIIVLLIITCDCAQ